MKKTMTIGQRMLTPCAHLNNVSERCEIGRGFPDECGHCSAYRPGQTAEEQRRCETWSKTIHFFIDRLND